MRVRVFFHSLCFDIDCFILAELLSFGRIRCSKGRQLFLVLYKFCIFVSESNLINKVIMKRFQIINAKTGFVFATNLTAVTLRKYLGFLSNHYKDVVFSVLSLK